MHSHREYRMTPDMAETLAPCAHEAELLTVLTDADRETDVELELDAFEMDSTNPEDAMTVIRENGKIDCFAAVNDIIENDTTSGYDWIELNVECGEEFRCRGYGAACVSALTRYYLEMGKGVEQDLDVTVDFVGAEENGRAVVVLRSKEYLPQLTLLRRQSAQVVTNTLEGIRVPEEALRILEG